MLTDSGNDAAGQRLSALMDGELEGAALGSACAQWRDEPHARASWHAYHLIGDVLRSDDLARSPARDADFLVALRARLANEPVVLAPSAAPAASLEASVPAMAAAGSRSAVRRFRSWRTPTAIAAGFVAVAGVLTLTRPGGPAGPSTAPGAAQMAQAGSANVRAGGVAERVALASPSVGEAAPPVAAGQFVRDARLDRYLAAHKQFAGSSALGVPSGYLRNATVESAGR